VKHQNKALEPKQWFRIALLDAVVVVAVVIGMLVVGYWKPEDVKLVVAAAIDEAVRSNTSYDVELSRME
jgi:hypothetical protein